MKLKIIFTLLALSLCTILSIKAQNCRYCKGTGKIIKEVAISTSHMHVQCKYCRGTGRDQSYSSYSNSTNRDSGIAKSRNRQDSYETTITEKPVKKTNSSFDYDIACRRRLTESDLYGLSKNELRIMRNWIFARHGYIFKTAAMKSYFSQKSWYNGRYNDVYSSLSAVEKYNVEFIKRHE